MLVHFYTNRDGVTRASTDSRPRPRLMEGTPVAKDLKEIALLARNHTGAPFKPVASIDMTEPFYADLVFSGEVGQSRSSSYFVFSDPIRNLCYPIYASGMPDVIKIMESGRVSGTWKFTKRGTAISLVLVED